MNIEQWRNDTPGCSGMIHFNNAGASLMTRQVADSIRHYIDREVMEGGYELARKEDAAINGFYDLGAKLLNCRPRNIAYTTNATDGFNRALSSIPFKAGDVILVSMNDYPSNYITFISLERRLGVKFVQIDNTPEGEMDLDDLRAKLKKYSPKLVSVTQVPTSSGLVQPVEAIGEIMKDSDSLYIVDACQSLGQLPVDARSIHADFISGTFRKFLRGPRGAGILYVSDKALSVGLEPLFMDLQGAEWTGKDQYKPKADAKRYEDWECAYALLMASSTALEYLLDIGVENVAARNKVLNDTLRNGIREQGKYTLQDRGKDPCSIITFTMPGRTAAEVKEQFAARRINVHTIGRDAAIFEFDEKAIDWVVRLSPHYYNTADEIACFLDVLDGL
jgi:selenocysteine lyase/cysteine desulfurase